MGRKNRLNVSELSLSAKRKKHRQLKMMPWHNLRGTVAETLQPRRLISASIKFFGNAENRTQGSWARSANATSVLSTKIGLQARIWRLLLPVRDRWRERRKEPHPRKQPKIQCTSGSSEGLRSSSWSGIEPSRRGRPYDLRRVGCCKPKGLKKGCLKRLN